MRGKVRLAGIFVLVSLSVAVCRLTFLAPDDATLVISASRTQIEYNETTVITILGYNSDGSYLWDGTRVDLSVENGALNRISVDLEDGTASVEATGNVSRGEMKITARSGSVVAEPNPLIIDVGTDPEVHELVISADPQFLPAGGGVSTITVFIYDQYYEPIANRPVLLTTNRGYLASAGAPLYSDADGRVVDYLTTTANAKVTARSGAKEDFIQVYVN